MVKLGDYGLPIALYSKENLSTLCHAAPEVFDGQREWKSDVWSLGITLVELAEKKNAFRATQRLLREGVLVGLTSPNDSRLLCISLLEKNP